jgi:hypothetical protein
LALPPCRSAAASGASIKDIQPNRGSKYPTGALRQFISLVHREFVLITRNPFDVAARSAACLTLLLCL